jgi:hypothetical protein
MGNMSKSFTLILILIMAISSLSLIMVKPTFGQTSTPTPSSVPIPTPSVPEFTVKYVNSSYEVPASTTINPYTGQNTTNQGYYVENRTIDVIIKNQRFTPEWVNDGSDIFRDTFYYNVRMKVHVADVWTVLYNPYSWYPTQSNSEFTVLFYLLDENTYPFWNSTYSGAQIDFQVQALIGAVHRGYNPSATNQLEMYPFVFTGEMSDWSNTQTVTIPATSTSASPTPTPSVPEFSLWTLLLLPTLMVSIGLLVYFKKHKHSSVNKP